MPAAGHETGQLGVLDVARFPTTCVCVCVCVAGGGGDSASSSGHAPRAPAVGSVQASAPGGQCTDTREEPATPKGGYQAKLPRWPRWINIRNNK